MFDDQPRPWEQIVEDGKAMGPDLPGGQSGQQRRFLRAAIDHVNATEPALGETPQPRHAPRRLHR